jgi:hypothetical protein
MFLLVTDQSEKYYGTDYHAVAMRRGSYRPLKLCCIRLTVKQVDPSFIRSFVRSFIRSFFLYHVGLG